MIGITRAFEIFGAPSFQDDVVKGTTQQHIFLLKTQGTLKNFKVVQLVEQIRSFGHTLAHINPMEDAANGQSLLRKQ